jgi:hypothetical protein
MFSGRKALSQAERPLQKPMPDIVVRFPSLDACRYRHQPIRCFTLLRVSQLPF